jgi:hypothetical protein
MEVYRAAYLYALRTISEEPIKTYGNGSQPKWMFPLVPKVEAPMAPKVEAPVERQDSV